MINDLTTGGVIYVDILGFYKLLGIPQGLLYHVPDYQTFQIIR